LEQWRVVEDVLLIFQLSSLAKGGLAVGEVQRAKQLVSARAGTLKEKRVTDLSAEISSLAA
jgi:hypothetical protein